MSVRDRQRDEQRDDRRGEAILRPFPARIRARVKLLDAHLLGVTVDRLNRATSGSDGQLVALVMRAHLLATSRDEPNAGVSQQTGGICGADAILVADEPRAGRQDDGHLVERRQIVIRCRQELEADPRAVRRAGQMQAQAKKLLVVGRIIPAKRSPTHVATAPRANTPCPCLPTGRGRQVSADRRQTGLTVGKQAGAGCR